MRCEPDQGLKQSRARAVSIQMMTKQASGVVGWISRFSGAIQRLILSMRSIANEMKPVT